MIGPFEKFTKVTTILPLTGRQYSDKVSENCVAFWKSVGIYTDAEAKAIEKFNEVLKDETFPPGNSILFTHSPLGALTVSITVLLSTLCFDDLFYVFLVSRELSNKVLKKDNFHPLPGYR